MLILTTAQTECQLEYLLLTVASDGLYPVYPHLKRRTRRGVPVQFLDLTRSPRCAKVKVVGRPSTSFGYRFVGGANAVRYTMPRPIGSRIRSMEETLLQGLTKLDKTRSEQIRTDLGLQPAFEFIDQRQLNWWGHFQRMNDRRVVKKIWEARSSKQRRRGRPKETWDSTTFRT
ncbi:hypothetical protein Trydic_g17788 [Trypoxylus dichotomus]